MTILRRYGDRIQFTEIEHPDYLVRGAVLRGATATLVWDTLTHPDDMGAVLPLLDGRHPIVVYSHADWDHVWGTAALVPAPQEVIGHRLCRRRFAAEVPATLRRKNLTEPGRWQAVRLVPPSRVFDDALTLDLGGMTLELHALPGHTADSIVGLAVEDGLLLMGDTVETPLPCVPPGCPLASWISGLAGWLADSRVTAVVPAHGPWGGKEVIRRTLDYLEDLQDGRPLPDSAALSPFYRLTHLENLRNCPTGRDAP